MGKFYSMLQTKIVAFWKKYRYTGIACFAFGLLAHLYMFTNKLPNHDDIYYFFSLGAGLESGRWGLALLNALFPTVSLSWFSGVLSLALISISACLITKMFGLENHICQVIIGGLFASFPSMIGNFSYMFTSAAYSLAILLSIIAFILAVREEHVFRNRLFSLVLSVLSLSIYQAYISVTASFIVIYLIQRLLEKDSNLRVILRRGIQLALLIVASLGVYYAITRIVLYATSSDFGDYAQGFLTGEKNPILGRLRAITEVPMEILFAGTYGIVLGRLSKYCHMAAATFAIIFLVVWAVKEPSWKKKGLLALLVFCYMVSLNILFLILPSDAVNTLCLFSYASVYVLLFVLIQKCPDNISLLSKMEAGMRCIVPLLMALIVISNIYMANKAYGYMQLLYENQYAKCESIMTRIMELPEYHEGVKVALIHPKKETGYMDIKNVLFELYFQDVSRITGISALKRYFYSTEYFLRYYLGFPGAFASEEEKDAIKETEQYREMPMHPYYGSITVINGTIVVKL